MLVTIILFCFIGAFLLFISGAAFQAEERRFGSAFLVFGMTIMLFAITMFTSYKEQEKYLHLENGKVYIVGAIIKERLIVVEGDKNIKIISLNANDGDISLYHSGDLITKTEKGIKKITP